MKYNTFFYAIILLLVVSTFSCSPAQQKSTEDSPYYVKDPNYIYFKNMRLYYYQDSLAPGGKPSERMNIYKLRNFADTKDRPILYPLIIDNWIKDEAYLFLKTNHYPIGEPITVLAIQEQDTTQVSLARATPDLQLALAQQIADFLEADQSIFVLDTAKQAVPLFQNRNDRRHFLTTVKDYRRLTE